MQLYLFLFPLQYMKKPALQNKDVGVLGMAFRARKVFGTFEKRAPGPNLVRILVRTFCSAGIPTTASANRVPFCNVTQSRIPILTFPGRGFERIRILHIARLCSIFLGVCILKSGVA